MKLVYRGVSYDYDPNATKADFPWNYVRQIRPSYNLTYRGVEYTVDPNKEPNKSSLRPVANLTYRGATYALNGQGVASAAKVGRVGTRSKMIAELATTHRNNLYRNVQRRLEIARDRGDQALVQLLEQELRQIA